MSTNTTKTIKEAPKDITSKLEKDLEVAKKAFEGQKLVEVSIPKSFADKIGPTAFLSINGVRIVLPVDGTKHKVPQSFADHLMDYLNGY